MDLYHRRRICLQEQAEFLPGKGFPLTSSVKPLEHDPDCVVPEMGYVSHVEGHPVVLDMSPHLAAESPPDLFQLESVPYFPSPLTHPRQFGPEAFAAGFHFRDDSAFTGLSQKERETEKIECALFDSFPSVPLGKGDHFR